MSESKQILKVSELYDSASLKYDQLVSRTNYIGPQWLLDNYLHKPNEKILDLGCANGINIKNLKQKGHDFEATGLDVSSKMIKEAEKSKLYYKLHTMSIDSSFYFSLTNYFTSVIALGCLEFVENLDNSLTEISRVLNVGGSFYASFQLHEPNNDLAPRATYSGEVTHFAYTKIEIEEKMKNKNFRIKKQEKITGYTGKYPCPYLFLISTKVN